LFSKSSLTAIQALFCTINALVWVNTCRGVDPNAIDTVLFLHTAQVQPAQRVAGLLTAGEALCCVAGRW